LFYYDSSYICEILQIKELVVSDSLNYEAKRTDDRIEFKDNKDNKDNKNNKDSKDNKDNKDSKVANDSKANLVAIDSKDINDIDSLINTFEIIEKEDIIYKKNSLNLIDLNKIRMNLKKDIDKNSQISKTNKYIAIERKEDKLDNISPAKNDKNISLDKSKSLEINDSPEKNTSPDKGDKDICLEKKDEIKTINKHITSFPSFKDRIFAIEKKVSENLIRKKEDKK